MNGTHKLDMTRPKFMLQMMSNGDVDRLDEGNMRKVMHDTSTLSYVVYTALMEANLRESDIFSIDNDGEAIAVKLESKNKAKEVAEICRRDFIRFGNDQYKVNAKVRDRYLVFTADKVLV